MLVIEQGNFYYQVYDKVQGIGKLVGSNEADRFLNVANWYLDTKRVKK